MPLPPAERFRVLRRNIDTRPYPRFGPMIGADEHCTDLGNGRRLAYRHGPDLRYAGGKWYAWDTQRWVRDANGEVHRCAKETVRSIVGEAQEATDEERRTKLLRHAAASESASRIRAMIELAQSEPPIAETVAVFDTDPMLFNCPNGTIDLRIGQLRAQSREDMITRLAGAALEL